MFFDREKMIAHYASIRSLTEDPDIWLESVIGSDLWVDGLNVFLTIGRDDFIEGLETFERQYDPGATLPDALQELHKFCLNAAKQGEFELYQSLAVGMTWLTMQEETNGQFFNFPVQVTNHTTALLLSPTYRAVWAQSFCEGLELVIDLEQKRKTIFRPEHGRIYQMGTWHQVGQVIRYPYQNYFHEMAHILLFDDLYARVNGESVAEDTSYFVHMEAVITCLEEVVLLELLACGAELNLIDDAFGEIPTFTEASAFRKQVYNGGVDGVTPVVLNMYLKQQFQLGKDDIYIPENAVKQTIVHNHAVPNNATQAIAPHYQKLVYNVQHHSEWGRLASERNRIPAYREVVELLPPHPFAKQMLEQALIPEFWNSPRDLFAGKRISSESWTRQRRRNQARWQAREALMRIAELRGYLAEQTSGPEIDAVQEELYAMAVDIARKLAHFAPAGGEGAAIYEQVCTCLSRVQDEELRRRLLGLFDHPFSYLLEPR